MNIHICLISDQLLANFLPIKLERPDKVFIIGTQYTEKKGLSERFEKLLALLNIPVQRATTLAPDDNFSQLHDYFISVYDEITALQADNITLNLTGGTKLMSLAAFQMLGDDCQRVIYTNTQADKIDELRAKTATPLPSLLTVEEYLISYGVSPKSYNNQSADWIDAVESRRPLTKQLADFFSRDKSKDFLSVINGMVQAAVTSVRTPTGGREKQLEYPKQAFRFLINSQKQLLNMFQEYQLIDYDGNKTIVFTSIEAAQYLGGFWLEEYAYLIATDVGVDEIRCGQAIQWDKVTRNELDMVIVHNNRLLIMECKTRRYDKDRRKDDDSIYKLDSVAEDLRGLYGSKWLLSVDNIDDRTQKRANSQGINVVAGGELLTLKDKLLAWKN